MARGPRRLLRAALPCVAALLAGCSTIGYYGQLAAGQKAVMRARQPIERIVADPGRDPALRQRLQAVLEARRWAVDHLLLPDNASYTHYVELDRPYVLWNLFAAPELSLQPLQNCFPLVGCMAYRGYYDRAAAERQATKLRARGYDAHVSGVAAYSTLHWFEDPVLSSMMRWSDEVLVGTLFHELAHQKLYVRDDTAFNESFASFVEEQGLAEYLQARGGDPAVHREHEHRRQELTALVLALRARLEPVYAGALPAERKRELKRAEFERLQAEYRELRDGRWSGYAGYDRWFESLGANNAALLPFGLYDARKPAFAALFEREGRDWARFYAAAELLARQPAPQREAALAALAR